MRILLILSITLLFSCNDKSLESCTDLKCDLNGEWSWTKTYGSIAGITSTPENTGDEQLLTFDDTHLSLFKNGVLEQKTTYEIFETDTIFNDGVTRNFITYNGNTRWLIYQNDSLTMKDLCFDCYDDYYIKN